VIASSGNFTVAPNLGLIAWSVLVLVSVLAGGVTAAKGRWGWLVAGILTAGLLWLVGALSAAAPGSLWTRVFPSARSVA
jgi:hypothetical protein